MRWTCRSHRPGSTVIPSVEMRSYSLGHGNEATVPTRSMRSPRTRITLSRTARRTGAVDQRAADERDRSSATARRRHGCRKRRRAQSRSASTTARRAGQPCADSSTVVRSRAQPRDESRGRSNRRTWLTRRDVTILVLPFHGAESLKKHSRSVAAACAVALVLFIALVAGTTGTAQQAPAATTPAPGQGARGGGRGPAPVNTLGAGPWDLGTGRSRVHVTLYAKDLDHPWGIAFLPDGGMLVTERPGRLRVIRNGVLDPDADRSAAGDARAKPRRPARRLAASALRGESPDLSHLLEARSGGRQRDDRGVPRALGWRLDADRRARTSSSPTRITAVRAAIRAWAPRPAATDRARLGQERPHVRHARRSQHRQDGAGSGIAHRQDPAAPRRWQRAAGQSVRGQGRIPAGDLHARSSQSARPRVRFRRSSSGPPKRVRRAATS